MTLISTCDLVITVAYFSIPLQILVSLWKSPPQRQIPIKLVVTLVLFAFFIFLCGTGHLMRYLGHGHTTAFIYVNVATAIVSMVTAIYLIPLIPSMFSLLDDALNKLTNESRESKSKLFTFMAFLCHEIRNPLFAITSSAEFLKDTNLRPEQAEEVSSISDSSLLMLRLVNDVLDLSKLDSGKLELEAREFNLHSLLKRLGENMSRQVERKHKGAVHMQFEMTPDVPRIIIGDSCRILQIVYNLLSNAIKFTSEGQVKLIVRLANEAAELKEQEEDRKSGAQTVTMSSDRPVAMLSSDFSDDVTDDTSGSSSQSSKDGDDKNLFSMALLDGDANADIEAGDSGTLLPNNPEEDIMVLSITVADSGIGIPPDRLKNIFEPYTQAKLSDFRQHGGTGLGLSIISSLIKAMSGTISVTSKGGEGARFHLKIPVRVPHNSTLDDEETDEEGVGGTNESRQYLECRRLPVYEENGSPKKGDRKKVGSAEVNGTAAAPLFSLGAAGTGSNNDRSSSPTDLLSSPMDDNSIINFDQSSSQSTAQDTREYKRQGSSGNDSNKDKAAASSLPTFNFPPRSNLVLVVDDNSVNRKILGKMLTAYNVEYDTACNGQEAVDKLLASRNATGDMSRPQFGLVFMDVSMPVMDGNTAIKTIRKANISVPIVALSANVLSQERDRTICLGADEFHTKPILRNDLHRLCTRFLYKNQNLDGDADVKHRRKPSGLGMMWFSNEEDKSALAVGDANLSQESAPEVESGVV